jgi:surfeit locus 1 family protein
MPRRTLLFVALALAGAVLFVRLGFWQLDRLGQRRARNAILATRIAAPPAAWSDTTAVRYRRVRIAGKPDYEREIVLVGRSRDGSPGVNLVTPLRLAGSDTAVLVNRGWVYSPDATRVDHGRWREGDTLAVEGYVEAFSEPGPGDLPATQRLARRLSHSAVSLSVPDRACVRRRDRHQRARPRGRSCSPGAADARRRTPPRLRLTMVRVCGDRGRRSWRGCQGGWPGEKAGCELVSLDKPRSCVVAPDHPSGNKSQHPWRDWCMFLG